MCAKSAATDSQRVPFCTNDTASIPLDNLSTTRPFPVVGLLTCSANFPRRISRWNFDSDAALFDATTRQDSRSERGGNYAPRSRSTHIECTDTDCNTLRPQAPTAASSRDPVYKIGAISLPDANLLVDLNPTAVFVR
ncbi:hypothetical protein BS17DRAFT_805244 [Gyrodon lividus]|nr:hypothetical protein BS17DRAFT_805244 [Gyrodon lividus]